MSLLVTLCSVIGLASLIEAAAEPVQFDTTRLRNSGLDPALAEIFKDAPRFPQGRRRVGLEVNGRKVGTVDASFDAAGQLCFDLALLDQANLMIPAARYRLSTDALPADTDCFDFVAAYAQTEIELRPQQQEVALLVSFDALRPMQRRLGVYQHGGSAGLLNYEVFAQSTQQASGSNHFYLGNTELGFNVDDWIVRSRQSFSVQNDVRDMQWLYTYGQKTFVAQQTVLQAGQINLLDSAFAGAALTGAQLLPEAGLRDQNSSGVTIEGIAQGPARVEIRQAGALIHSSLVPAGPFRLEYIHLLNSFDLDVLIIETNGEQHGFSVPAVSLIRQSMATPGFSIAAGRLRTFDAPGVQGPLVLTGSGGWLLDARNLLSTGLLLSDNGYQTAAWTLGSNVTSGLSANLRHVVSRATQEGVQGSQVGMGLDTRLDRLSAGLHLTRETTGYRDLSATTQQMLDYRRGLGRDQYGFTLGWSDDWLGGLGLGYWGTHSSDANQARQLNAYWNKSFKRTVLSLNLEHNRSRSRNSSQQQSALYFSLSLPLGNNRRLRSYAQQRSDTLRLGTTYDDSSDELMSYRLSAEQVEQRRSQHRGRNFSGNLYLLPGYTQVGLGYSRNDNDSSTYSGQLSGGMALHGDGVTLSPYALQDTFAVAKVGDLSGVRLSTPSGPVWTDRRGYAVIAHLSPYQPSQVQLDTRSLPRNVDIVNAYRATTAARGAVPVFDFSVQTSRRLLLLIRDEQDQPLPKGASVLDVGGSFITMVLDNGQVFLSDALAQNSLTIRLDHQRSCHVNVALPEKPDLDVYFETIEARCVESPSTSLAEVLNAEPTI